MERYFILCDLQKDQDSLSAGAHAAVEAALVAVELWPTQQGAPDTYTLHLYLVYCGC